VVGAPRPGALVCCERLRYRPGVRLLGLLPGILCVALATTAFAQGSPNKAAAEALFIDGRNLMAAGKFEEACPKFEASQKLEPGLGTMLNLAQCYEKTGRTASAWAQYREAIPLARAASSAEREGLARERSKLLESRLSTLTIRTTGTALDVRRDGVSVAPAELGSPIPVDPGSHKVEASAPGKVPWSAVINVGAEAAAVSVDVPNLEAAPGERTPPGAPAAANGGTPPGPGAPLAADHGAFHTSIQKPLAVGIAAAGVVGLGLGSYFGLSAGSKWDDAKAGCRDYPYDCSQAALDEQKSASSQATVSTIAFIAGGVAVAAGAVLWFSAGSGDGKTALGVGPGKVVVKGSF